ncbi:hypothetical protein BDU57DRAFT_530451 [Ampelomyces quisqualis]|uniref:RanBP2-type domain-containing protein n=1 Tax=Ampelomyces quisqualis TaxID=50730 RepID=A0A6A5QN62_AMPQU|nr:hypothetical protein BDU57DRAFT_530451 [Ampelomyces quisqualis]
MSPDPPISPPIDIEITKLSSKEVKERKDSAQCRQSHLSLHTATLPQASLQQIRESSIEQHSPPLRRRLDPGVQDPLAPVSSPTIRVRNPVQEPNWPDTAFTKAVPQDRHLASETWDKIEMWTCGNAECAVKNEKDAKKCASCGRDLPEGVFETVLDTRDRKKRVLEVPEGLALRDMADGRLALKQHIADQEDRPVGDAPGGGKWIPKRKYT